MRRWSSRRRAYSGVGTSCPNGILLTLVTSGTKYRLDSNVHRATSDSQDRMCRSMDRCWTSAPFRSGSYLVLFCPSVPIQASLLAEILPPASSSCGSSPWGMWGWSGHRSSASVWQRSCPQIGGGVLIYSHWGAECWEAYQYFRYFAAGLTPLTPPLPKSFKVSYVQFKCWDRRREDML